jgi:hypothetical protein
MAQIIPFPYRASKLAYLPAEDYFEAILLEALMLETAHNLAPDDEEILHRLMTTRALLIALAPEEPDAMPTEQPKMPFDSHARALHHGANRGLPLQAGEVAEFPHRSSFEALAERVLIVACVVGACGVAGILAAIAIRTWLI